MISGRTVAPVKTGVLFLSFVGILDSGLRRNDGVDNTGDEIRVFKPHLNSAILRVLCVLRGESSFCRSRL